MLPVVLSRMAPFAFPLPALLAGLFLSLTNLHATVAVGPLLEGLTTTNIYVLAECDSTNTMTVNYGITAGYGSVATTAFTKSTGTGSYVVHRIKLTGLTPNTVYHYQLAGQGTTSLDYTFRTLVNPGTNFRFGWDADYRVGGGGYAPVHSAIASRVMTIDQPLFLMEGGDTCNDGSWTGWHNEFFLTDEKELEKSIPIYPTPGNHEGWGTLPQAYYQSPDSSGTDGYYSFDCGDVHVTMANFMFSYSLGSDQYKWIQQDVSSSLKPWKIFGTHAPAYTYGGSHPGDAGFQVITTNILEPAGVKVFLAGHNHFYQHNLVRGIRHLTVGAAGAPLATPTTGAYTVKSAKDNCYLVADVSATNLHMVVYNTNGVVLDTIDLNKLPAPANLATVAGDGQVHLTWDAVPGEPTYTVLYGTTDGGPYPTRQTNTTASATVTGLANGATYYFVVTATDVNGPSAISAQASTTLPGVPLITDLGVQTDGNFGISGTGTAGQPYVLVTASNLIPPIAWSPVMTNTANGDGLFSLLDTQATNYSQRFYRVRSQ